MISIFIDLHVIPLVVVLFTMTVTMTVSGNDSHPLFIHGNIQGKNKLMLMTLRFILPDHLFLFQEKTFSKNFIYAK